MRSPSKRILRPSSGELEGKLEEERQRRRRQRLVQVRRQCDVRSKQVLKNAELMKESELKKRFESKVRAYSDKKRKELESLETKFRNNLSQLDAGRTEVAVEREALNSKLENDKSNRELAAIRGCHALNEEKNQRVIDEKVSKSRMDMRKSAILSEKLRSARITREVTNRANLVEFNAAQGVFKSKIVPKSFLTDENKENVQIKKAEALTDGFQEAEKERAQSRPKPVSIESLELMKLQREASLKVKRAMAEFMAFDDDVDLIPTKEVSHSSEDSPRIEAQIIRGFPESIPSTPASAFHEPVKDFRTLHNQIFQKSEERPKKKQFPIMPSFSEDSGSLEEEARVPKKVMQSIDDEFIAGVLGLRTNTGGKCRDVGVKINISETSTFSTSSMHEKSSSFSKQEVSYDEPSLSSNGNSTGSQPSPSEDVKLRFYIEKLLNMNRKEIEDLSSLTETSCLAETSSLTATPAASILSGGSRSPSSKNPRSKTVRFSPSTSTEEEDSQRRRERPRKGPSKKPAVHKGSIYSFHPEIISEGPLSSTTLSDTYSTSSSSLSLSPTSSKVNELKDKIFNMKIPKLPKFAVIPDKTESTSTFNTDSIFLSTTDGEEKTIQRIASSDEKS